MLNNNSNNNNSTLNTSKSDYIQRSFKVKFILLVKKNIRDCFG